MRKKAAIYVHGKGGSHLEVEQYKQNCINTDIFGVDYCEYLPWLVCPKIKATYNSISKEYQHISIIANSIGAYFAMHALQDASIKKALFISPIVDMEKLILDMMHWASITEDELYKKGEIQTDFGEVLSWEYLNFVRTHPLEWNIPTEILYAENDNLTSQTSIDKFVKTHNAKLTICKNCEHWFHTDEQILSLNDWMKKAIY